MLFSARVRPRASLEYVFLLPSARALTVTAAFLAFSFFAFLFPLRARLCVISDVIAGLFSTRLDASTSFAGIKGRAFGLRPSVALERRGRAQR